MQNINYGKEYEKAIKYSQLNRNQDDEDMIDERIRHHTRYENNKKILKDTIARLASFEKHPHQDGVYNDKLGHGPILADILEEQDAHLDSKSLQHLREHQGPYRIYHYPGSQPSEIRAVRPVYGCCGVLNDYRDAPYIQEHLDAIEQHGPQFALDHFLATDATQPEYPRNYDVNSSHNKDDKVWAQGNFLMGHNPTHNEFTVEHIKYIPIDEFTKLKKERDRENNGRL